MQVVFVGHFAPQSHAAKQASSAAGNQVQRQIFQELVQQCGPGQPVCYSMTPQSFWPQGPFISRSVSEGSTKFIGYINLPVLKHVVFALRLLAHLLVVRPQLCLQYNSYLFENLALLLFRLSCSGTAIAIIIQDIHVAARMSLLTKRGLRSFSERTALRLAKRFDMIIPFSSEIISDFRFAPSKCFVFQGGITEFAVQVMSGPEQELVEIGVFAGGLEPHNGIDRLVDKWLVSGVEHPLHVFGRGSLEEHVRQAAQRSDRIVFHGFQPEHVVLAWQRRARWNFCLRYSAGLNQTYFFPSKLFNILCAPGAVVVNDFHALPSSVRSYLCVVADDLSDLAARLPGAATLASPDCVCARREVMRDRHSWRSCVQQIVHFCVWGQMTNVIYRQK